MIRTMWGRLRTAWGETWEEDRGDVPGWVLVTLMTAAIIVGIWAVAGPAFMGLFEDALSRVEGF
ncbi:hypothetical protein [Microbacterium sp.]|uniref:hypothetical protein n=1 Tax=Microbacterium sp. TaxID=51671 RepID=UPI0039E35568